MSYLYIAGTVIFIVYSQLIIKWRIVKYGVLPDELTGKLLFLVRLIFDPFIISGFISAFLASLLWMAAMTKFELSHAYPIIIGGLAILTSIFAIVLFNETLGLMKIIGLTLIVIGLYCLSNG